MSDLCPLAIDLSFSPFLHLNIFHLKIVYTIADLQPESGGPSRSVSALATAVAEQGNEAEVIALEYGRAKLTPRIPEKPVQTTFVPCRGALAGKLKWSSRFKVTLRDRCQSEGNLILHDNGLWLSTNHTAAVVSRELKIPLIVSSRGMLTQWALQHKSWKKRLSWQLYQRRDLKSAQLLHATSAAEATDYRAAGLTQPIAVLPNGVELTAGLRESEVGNRKSEVRTLLFLGRIHPIKGLVNLVAAWKTVNWKLDKWRVVIAGGGEPSHVADLKAEIASRMVESDFEFVGPVEGKAKWDLYRSADLFVLPSHSENFGIVIAEALACGVPVIASRGTPWAELETHRCGWWVDNRPETLVAVLRDAMGRTDVERQEMGRRGRELVTNTYSWNGIAKQMSAVYRWMLGQGPKPECIV
jgi:glycosyltransferase involved in cell wall biosynthesis